MVVVEQLRVAQAEQLALRPPLQAGQDEQGYDDQGGAAAAEGEAQETLVGKIPYGLLKMGPELVNSDACPRPATGAEIQAPWEGLGGRIKALRRTSTAASQRRRLSSKGMQLLAMGECGRVARTGFSEFSKEQLEQVRTGRGRGRWREATEGQRDRGTGDRGRSVPASC